jgi:hypothetical protein
VATTFQINFNPLKVNFFARAHGREELKIAYIASCLQQKMKVVKMKLKKSSIDLFSMYYNVYAKGN